MIQNKGIEIIREEMSKSNISTRKSRFLTKLILFLFVVLWAQFSHASLFSTKHLLVKFKRGAPASVVANGKQIFANLNSKAQILSHLKSKGITVSPAREAALDSALDNLSRWRKIPLQSGEDPQLMLNRFKNNPNVEAAELDMQMDLAATPNDSRYLEQWALTQIAAEAAWDISTGSESVVVAVFDTGMDWRHPDLTASACNGEPLNCVQTNMWVNDAELNGSPFVDDDNNGCVDDVLGCLIANGVLWGSHQPDLSLAFPTWDEMGHGTAVGGTIGALGNNETGIAGLNWHVQLMPMKVFHPFFGLMSDLSLGIMVAADSDVRVANISLSWTSSTEPTVMRDAINYAAARSDMLVVVAAGNHGRDLDDGIFHNYPPSLNLANMINVAATDQNDNLWDGSNFGTTTVHVAAPGVGILSLSPLSDCHPSRGDCDPSGYQYHDGTSLASPLVAGTAALLLANDPTLTSQELKARILDSADVIPSLANTSVTGGRLNVASALNMGGSGGAVIPPGNLGGVISSDSVLVAGDYFVTSNVIVNSGVSLIIQAGANLYFSPSIGIEVNGQIVTQGTGQSPVLMTSSNGTPARGDWQGITLNPGSSGHSLDHTEIRWAKSGINATGVAVTVRNSFISDYKDEGIRFMAGAGGLVENNVIDGDSATTTGIYSTGIYMSNASVDIAGISLSIQGNQIENSSFALQIHNHSTPVINNGNTIINNGYGFYIKGDGVSVTNDPQPVINNNSFYNNPFNNFLALGFASSTGTIDATNNWWGTTNPNVIAGTILDRVDFWVGAPIIDFDPMLTSAP